GDSLKALCVAVSGALSVWFERVNNANYLLSCKRHRRLVRDFRSLQFNRRIILNPFSLFSETHEGPEPFQLFQARARPFFPRCSECCECVQVELREELQFVGLCKSIELTK